MMDISGWDETWGGAIHVTGQPHLGIPQLSPGIMQLPTSQRHPYKANSVPRVCIFDAT
jgi:hypothetical protein